MMAFGAKIKLSVNTSGASAFRSEIQKYVNTATENKPIKLKNFSVSITKEQQKKIIRDIQTYLSGDTTLTLKIGQIDATGAVNKLRQQLQTMLSGLSITGLKEFLDEADIDAAKQAASQWAAQMRVVDNIQTKLGSTYKSALSGSQMIGDETQVQQITAAYTVWQTKVEELRNTQIALSDEELQNLQQAGIALQKKITLIQEARVAAKQADEQKKRDSKQEEADAKKELLLAQQQVSLKAQVQKYILSNSKAYKAYSSELDGIMHQLQSEAKLTDEQIKTIRTSFVEIQNSARAAGLTGATFFDTLKKGWEKFGGWSLVTKSMTAAWRVVTKMISAVKELDSAMTELKKVTDLSEISYQNFLKTAQSMSQAVGATLADTVNATADFARLGYSLYDSTALAEAALVYKNVGDGIADIGVASESLISTIKAFEQFGESASNAMSIVDRFNEVGNNFAISSEGLGEALQRSASALASAGNTLNESIALVTGMNAVVQDPDSVGTALKTISMYLRAAKTEAEEAGASTDGMANSVSELRKELLTLTKDKVDIMIDDKTFKSTYEIMKELSKIWNDLADIDKANIIELIGGKRNANAITSLLTNFEDAENALQTASSAAGSALAENEKYLDSIAGKVSVLQSKFETFSNNLIDSAAVKSVIDLGSVILTLLDFLNPVLPLIAGISTALILVAKQGATSVNAITNQIKLETKAFQNDLVASESLKVSIAGLTKAEQKHLVVQLQRKIAAGELDKEQYKQIIATLGLSAAEKGLVAADGALIVSNKGLAASFKSLMASVPVLGWISLGISVVLELATTIGYFADKAETSAQQISRLDDELNELINNAQSVSSKYSELKKNADEIIPRFAELAKGVDAFGKNISLTDDEYKEFLSLNNQIAEMFPTLDMGLDSNGNHILALSNSIDTLTASLESLVEAERYATNEKNADSIDKALKNIKSANKSYAKEIKQAEANREYLESVYGAIPKGGTDESGNTVGHQLVVKNESRSNTKALDERDALLRNLGVNVTSEYVNNNPTNATRSAVFNYSFVYDEEEVERNYQNMLAGYDAQIASLQEKNQLRWQKMNPVIGAWLQTTDSYNVAEDNVQALLSKIIGNIDYSEIGSTNEKKLKDYIQTNFIAPITEANPEVQNAMIGLFDIKSAFDSGKLTVGEFGITDYILKDLRDAGINDKILSNLKVSLNIDDFNDEVQSIKGGLSGLSSEYTEQIDYYNEISNEITDKNIDTSKTIFGNIDTNNRQVLEWTNENLSKYKDALESWGTTTEEIKGSFSTVFGGSDTFDDIEIAFSPILQTSDGAVLLDQDTVYEYIWGLIDKAGEGWTNEDLLRLDTEGLEFDGIQIKNILADIGDSAQNTAEIMHYVGEDGALNHSYKELKNIADSLDISVDELISKYSSINNYIDSLSNSELKIAYNIVQAEGSMSIEELKEKVDRERYSKAKMVEPLDTEDFIKGLDAAADGVDKVVSAMEKLAKGTALTKKEMMDLIAKYPELLQQADIFADGSVEAQKNAFNSILDMQEQEYDAQIDAKIAELKATEQVLDDQLELEEQKANLINDIKNMEIDGKVTQEGKFIDKLNEFNDLQGRNFVSLADGEVQVNEEALNDQLEQGANFGEESAENIWEPLGQTIVSAHEQGYTGALTATNNYTTSLWGRIKKFFSNIGSSIATAWQDMWSNNWQDIDVYFSKAFGTGTGTISGDVVSVEFGGSKTTIDGVNVDDWVSQQEKASQERIAKIKEIKGNTLTAISNLEKLKGLKLTDIYASDGSSKSGSSGSGDKDKKSDEENIFKTMYDYHKHLVDMERETTAEFLKWLDDAYKTAYKAGEITLDEYYRYEEEVFDGMKTLRDNAKNAVDDLIDYRLNILKKDVENEKDAISKKLDYLKEFYDKQKDMLQDQYDDEEYLKEQSEKRKSVSDIQAQLAQLEFDDSAWAQKRKAELQKDLTDAQGELDDFEKQHALDLTLDALENSYNEQEAQLQKQIDALDAELNNPELMFNKALLSIQENTGNLYQQMIEYNRKYGTGNDDDVKNTYEEAYKALLEYKKLYGKDYEGVKLTNATGYKPNTNPNTSSASGNKASTPNASSTSTNSSNSAATKNNAPSLSKGSSITVKDTATHFGSKSRGVRMASFVPGGTYTVYQTSGNEVLIGKNGVYTGWINKSDIVGYASGTKMATAGIHAIDEVGAETIFESKDGTRYKLFTGGEKVLNAQASNFLYDFATSGGAILEDMIKKALNGGAFDRVSPLVNNTEVKMGDIIIQGDCRDQTVSEIRRAQRDNLRTMLKELNQLNK